VVLAWYGPAVAQHGLGYLRETIIHQHVVRYAQTWVHKGPWYYYLPEFITGFFPWSLFVPGAIALGWRASRISPSDPATPGETTGPPRSFLFPLAWFGVGFVFFSLSTSKRGAYLLPLYPAAALMVGWLWDRAGDARGPSRWLSVPVTLLAGAAVALAAGLLLVPKRFVPGRMVDTLVPSEPWLQWTLAALLLVGGGAVWWAWRRQRFTAALGTLVAVQSIALLVVATVRAPQYEARYPARELAGRIAALTPADRPILSLLGDYDFIVAFYLDRPITPLPGPAELLAARGPEPRHALLDGGDREALRAPGVHALAEGRLGPKRVILVRLDPRSR
jgi:4-amino-4-deoxy-L-arabinose transferase-like glycosyltransferase